MRYLYRVLFFISFYLVLWRLISLLWTNLCLMSQNKARVSQTDQTILNATESCQKENYVHMIMSVLFREWCIGSLYVQCLSFIWLNRDGNEQHDFEWIKWWFLYENLVSYYLLPIGAIFRSNYKLLDCSGRYQQINVKFESSTQINEQKYHMERWQMNEIAWWVYTIWGLINRLAY